ncbi:MAG: exosortase E/protease, VPEID-CTERM system [Paracoccaceae bacterium]
MRMVDEGRREPGQAPAGSFRLYRLAALFALEFVAIVLVFQLASSVECRATSIEAACRGLRDGAIRGMCLFAALGLLLGASPALRARLVGAAARRSGGWGWAALHGAGLALIFLPWLAADPATLNAAFAGLFGALLAGAGLAAVGGVFWVLSPADWAGALRQGGWPVGAVALVGLAIPDLARALEPAWTLQPLAQTTFAGVALLLSVLGAPVGVDPPRAIIGVEGFFVEVADQCSGIEGFALVTGFLAIYALITRATLRMGRFWLLVFPLALLASWLFNLLRIAALILIGANVSPELAVNGFHSFAGWLAFTVLALGVLWAVQVIPGLHRGGAARAAALPPLTEDRNAAFIVPFIAFMLAGLVTQAFWAEPALGYPLVALAMACALWLFRKPFLALDWRADPVALGAGLVVGLLWVVTAPASEQSGAVAALTPAALVLWATIRLMGTSVLVPLVEEAFFRGYLLARLDTGGWPMRLVAVALSSAGFAALHGRYLEAGLAGIVFAAVMLRQGRLADAILAHAAANLIVFAAALLRGDWSLI